MSLGSCVVGSLRLSHYDDCDASVVARTWIANYQESLIDRGEGAAPTTKRQAYAISFLASFAFLRENNTA